MSWLMEIKNELWVVGMAAVPVVELRGAIPFGMGLGMSAWKSFWLAYIGSMLPVPLLLLFLRPVIELLKKVKALNRFAHWIENRCSTKGAKVRKYSLLGLFAFVAIPIPSTGVWTGSGIAAVLDLRIKHALPVIALGNFVAGLLMLAISNGLFSIIQ